MDFGPFGLSEVVFIGLLALVLFGPRRLPELARTVGAWMTVLRRGTEDLKRSFREELEQADGGASRELRSAAEDLRTIGSDLQQVKDDGVAAGRRLLEPVAESQPRNPAPRIEAAEPGGEPSAEPETDDER